MKLNFRSIGYGPPLLILHGLLGSLDNWVPQAQLLAAHFQVLLPDLRNHGRSPHAAEFDHEVMVADIVELIQDQNLGQVSVLGHSLGGKVAMRLAQLHPDKVRRLVVVDIAPREDPPRYADILTAMQRLDLHQFQRREQVNAALFSAVPEKRLRQFLLKNLGRNDTGGLYWKPNLAAIAAGYVNACRALPTGSSCRVPTLFVRGGKSDYLREEDAVLIQRMLPESQMTTLAAAGHWVHADAPEEFRHVVTAFLLG